MIYRFIYNDAYKRVIPATLIDSRGVLSIATASGFAVKDYTDSEVAKVTANVIPYKIETDNGTLAGYFNLTVTADRLFATLLNKQLRPAFVKFDSDIANKISIFITSNDWQVDIL